MKKLNAILILSIAILMEGCTFALASSKADKITPSRNYISKAFDINGFTAIRSNSIIDVEYTQSTGYSKIEVTAPENLMQYVSISKSGSTLNIDCEKFSTNNFSGNFHITAKVTAPAVTGFTLNGTGDIKFMNALNTKNDITITSNGTGDVEGPTVICSRLSASSNGTGDIDISSVESKYAHLSLVGTGDIDIISLRASDAKIRLLGTGDIELKTLSTTSLDASLSGTGDIDINGGTAVNASLNLTGTGDINAKKLKVENATVNNLSVGDVECFATESLTIYNSGIGSVEYKGSPRKLDIVNGKGIKRIK